MSDFDNPEQDQLAMLRTEMDEATDAFLAALGWRARVAARIATEKRRLRIGQVKDPGRELDVLGRVDQADLGPLPRAAARRVLQAAMDEASFLQVGPDLPLTGPNFTETQGQD
jgi:chorismate mutase